MSISKDPIFDLEQQIMEAWGVVDDVDMITKHFADSPDWGCHHFSPEATDAMMNKYFAVKELYALKFERLFHTFEAVCKEYHKRGKIDADL
jgi:hypothetical protein